MIAESLPQGTLVCGISDQVREVHSLRDRMTAFLDFLYDPLELLYRSRICQALS